MVVIVGDAENTEQHLPQVTNLIVPQGSLVLELHAEQLSIAKRVVQRLVQVRSETVSREVDVDEPLNNEAVVVERVAIDRFVDAIPPVRQEGDVTILPVVEEVVVTERRLRLREEVHIRRVRTTARHTETVTLREQRAVVTRSELGTQWAGPAAQMTDSQTNTRMSNMSETIVAVYDTAAHAEQAIADLVAAKVPQSSINRHTSTGSYTAGGTTPMARPTEDKGFWSSLFGGDAGTDNNVYESSMASGGNVVTVSSIPDHDYMAVMEILEKHSPVDIDERASTYASSTTATTGTMQMGTSTTGTSTMAAGASMLSGTSATTSVGTAPMMGTAVNNGGMVQLSEEQIAIGKRVVNRGGTRIRRYVVETPVEESVTLHSEKVMLERRPVTDGRPLGDGSFSEKTIEMTETAEEAVVSKTARVVEEVGLRKEATDRVETVRDTVRKEEVEIEQIPGVATTTTTTTSGTLPKV